MEHVLRARMGAARLVLEGLTGTPNHAPMSKVQANALATALRSNTVSSEKAAELSQELMSINWHKNDGAALLSLLVPAEMRRPRGTIQRK